MTSFAVNGSGVLFSYDNDGLLVSAGDLTISRNAGNGFVEGTSLGSVLTNNTYNEYGELSSFGVEKSGSDFLGVSYTRDALGRIASKTEIVDGVSKDYSYEYDLAGRLVIVSVDGIQTAQYSYDDNGNRTSTTKQGEGDIVAAYDDQDRLTQYGNTTYTYTTNGELKTKTDSNGMATYTYDEFGNLKSVVMPKSLFQNVIPDPDPGSNTAQIDYIIDSTNRRVGKKINNVLVSAYLYEDSLRLIAELNPDGSLKSRFIYGTRVNVPEYMVKAGVKYRIVTDHLGSVRFVINVDSGDVVQQIDYDEFGVILNDTNPNFQPFGFTGGLYDIDTKLTRFGARDYNATTGRWTSKDPIGFNGGDTNLYGYVLNDPVNFYDPLGLSPADVQKIKQIFEERIVYMNESNKRINNPYLNNIISLYQKAKARSWYADDSYLGCKDQAILVTDTLREGVYDDDWVFKITPQTIWSIAVHYYGVAISSNAQDPSMIYDPWKNKFIINNK